MSHISLSGFALAVRGLQQALHSAHRRPLLARRRWRPAHTLNYLGKLDRMDPTIPFKRQRVEATGQDDLPATQQPASVATASPVTQPDSQAAQTRQGTVAAACNAVAPYDAAMQQFLHGQQENQNTSNSSPSATRTAHSQARPVGLCSFACGQAPDMDII